MIRLLLSSLIWVYPVCSGLFVQKLRNITVIKTLLLSAQTRDSFRESFRERTISLTLLNGCACGFKDHYLHNWCYAHFSKIICTIMFPSFRTDRPGQTVQTQIRLLLRVYTVCNSLCIFWMHYSKEKPSCSTFRVITAIFRVSEILGFLWYIQ